MLLFKREEKETFQPCVNVGVFSKSNALHVLQRILPLPSHLFLQVSYSLPRIGAAGCIHASHLLRAGVAVTLRMYIHQCKFPSFKQALETLSQCDANI